MLKEDLNQIQTVDDLKKIVNPDESRGRTKFVVKIFYILQFVKNHPNMMEELGASWCEDGIHFVSNSKKLADFLDLKSNSINTNFRDHGFKIISCNTAELKKDFPNIKETRHWKKRYSKCEFFSSTSTIKEVEQIKLIDQNIESYLPRDPRGDQQNQFNSNSNDRHSFQIPSETAELLKNDQSQLFSLIQMYFASAEDDVFFQNFLTFVTNLWKSRINTNGESALIQNILAVLLNKDPNAMADYDEEIDERTLQYEKNIEYLLPQNFENSQICDYISFFSFAKYFIRYCDQFDFASTLIEITSPVFNDDPKPSFQNWFHPSTDKNRAIELLKKQEGESWIVIPSKAPNKFTLLFSDGKEPFNIQALHIKHNPIPSDPTKRYSIVFNNGEKYGRTLDELFTKELKLSYPVFLTDETYKVTETSYVSGDNIANRQINNNNNSNNNNILYYNTNTNTNFAFEDSQTDTQSPFDHFSLNSQTMEFMGQSQDGWIGISQSSQIGFSQDFNSQINDNDSNDENDNNS